MKTRIPGALGALSLLLTPLLAQELHESAAPPVPAQVSAQQQEESEAAPQEEPRDIAGPVEDIIDEYDEAMSEFWRLYGEAEGEDAQSRIYAEHYPDADEYSGRLAELVEQSPTSPAAVTAIAWVLNNASNSDQRSDFLTILLEHHADSSELSSVCMPLSRDSSVEVEAFLRELIEKGETPAVIGSASYALAGVLGTRLDIAETVQGGDADTIEAYANYYGEEIVAHCRELDSAALKAERKALLESARDEYGEVDWGRGTLASEAGGELFELENLQIGMVAPEISGEDLDGVPFKLSDYRGQVVFLDFWGDW